MQFAANLHSQLSHRPVGHDRSEFIASSLACHVDVLIHTANVPPPDVDTLFGLG